MSNRSKRTPLLTIREMRPDDAQAFLEVHHAAVRAMATKDYPPSVIEAWAPLPLTEDAVERVRKNVENEYRVSEPMPISGKSFSLCVKEADLGCADLIA
jgi:hypothetical protein